MPTLRTRAGKGSDLTPTEADANFKRTVTQKTTTYACLVSDNNAVIEGNHATTAFTITLGDAATMLAAETGSYVITITNIGAAVVTVARAGSDTINGAATSLTLNQYSTVTLQVVSAGDGYETIARTGDRDIVSFTPVFRDDSATDESETYSVQTGNYVDLGSVVYGYVRLNMSDKGTLTSSQQITILGFPITLADVDIPVSVKFYNLAAAATTNHIAAHIDGSTIKFTKFVNNTQHDNESLLFSDVDADFSIVLSFMGIKD